MNRDKKLTQSIAGITLVTGLILLIPLALQLTIGTGVDGQGFNWKPGDFVVMGALLFATGLGINFVTRRVTSPVYRVIAVVTIVLAFLLIWADLAVGIFNIPGISES